MYLIDFLYNCSIFFPIQSHNLTFFENFPVDNTVDPKSVIYFIFWDLRHIGNERSICSVSFLCFPQLKNISPGINSLFSFLFSIDLSSVARIPDSLEIHTQIFAAPGSLLWRLRRISKEAWDGLSLLCYSSSPLPSIVGWWFFTVLDRFQLFLCFLAPFRYGQG